MNKKQLWETKIGMLKQTLASMKQVMAINQQFSDDIARDIINEYLLETAEQSERLTLRTSIAKNNIDNLRSETGAQIATMVRDNELLKGILRVLWETDNDSKIKAMGILSVVDDNENYANSYRVKEIIRYFRLKGRCIYQDVISFIDANYEYICKEEYCIGAINEIIYNFTEEGLKNPQFTRIDDIRCLNFAIDEDDFLSKTKESMIGLVNGIFLGCFGEIPLMRTETFTEDRAMSMIKQTFCTTDL